ncbi:sulfatase-like hydrolase/transferase [Croceivirga sp. JEA036]|uniref:sulfatase-like hydrolase/transferase n=1 Tax=Croceivirga sp. JEA036 TaxID=2721162 RepID=UPI00143B9B01|nr:sulfatase-like hydrolase/transferase [Croceivirga sp. JEA036]NJB37399.1 sulfatase-like hydrolase/transferase [Croceivirga sp. JEA036]
MKTYQLTLVNRLLSILVICLQITPSVAQTNASKKQPNILWIVTDDHRYDAVRGFNKMIHGREMSELGYVESPNIDRLIAMGTTYKNTYVHSPVCAPSRSAMHLGRYPFRSGIYQFEYYNNNLPHFKPTLPEQMVKEGYQTFHVGKLGVRIKTLKEGKPTTHPIYQNAISFKQMHKDGLTDWGKDWIKEVDGQTLEEPLKSVEYFVSPEGTFTYASLELEKERPSHRGKTALANKKYDILRHYKKGEKEHPTKGIILSGVSPQPAGKTRDGYYNRVLLDYLNNTAPTFTVGSQTVAGIAPDKPLFVHLGYDFPHTPVLPPATFRERFQQETYKVPQFTKEELAKLPEQIKRFIKSKGTDHFTAEEKQKMIQDYYAFCAYGDSLIGEAVDGFIAYSEAKKQPWTIVYVHGDHGWKLNDHGAVSKCTPWELDSHNPIVIVSSNKEKYPAGKVVDAFAEFVDIAPTILAEAGADITKDAYTYLDGMDLALIANGTAPERDYIIGESHAATGPRAYIRTKEYVFSMRIRPQKARKGEQIRWALTAPYQAIDPSLYHTTKDPKELNNVAFDKAYKKIAQKMRVKLANIVLGDNRVEVDWGTWGEGTKVYYSNFAPGVHDFKLNLD